VESAEDYDDGGDILGEDGDGVGRVEEMYDDEWVSGEHDKAEDDMSLEHESDYNNVADGYLSMNNFPDVGNEEGSNEDQTSFWLSIST